MAVKKDMPSFTTLQVMGLVSLVIGSLDMAVQSSALIWNPWRPENTSSFIFSIVLALGGMALFCFGTWVKKTGLVSVEAEVSTGTQKPLTWVSDDEDRKLMHAFLDVALENVVEQPWRPSCEPTSQDYADENEALLKARQVVDACVFDLARGLGYTRYVLDTTVVYHSPEGLTRKPHRTVMNKALSEKKS